MNQHYPPRPVGAVVPPPPSRSQPDADFIEFVEKNADRIWNLLRLRNQRDLTFNQLARQLWSSI